MSLPPYSIVQSSHKPAQIQKAGKEVTILDERRVKEFKAIFKPRHSLPFQITYSKERSAPFITEEYNQESILYSLLYCMILHYMEISLFFQQTPS